MVMTDLDAREKRSDFALAGVGYDGCCFPSTRAAPYVVTRSAFSRVSWLFAGTGLGPSAAFGRLQGELDRTDPELTPHDHVVAAEAIVRGRHGVIHSEMTYSRVSGGGSVFAAGSTHFLRIPRRSPGGTPVPLVMLDNLWKRTVGGG